MTRHMTHVAQSFIAKVVDQILGNSSGSVQVPFHVVNK